jgi:hypothetical protein
MVSPQSCATASVAQVSTVRTMETLNSVARVRETGPEAGEVERAGSDTAKG